MSSPLAPAAVAPTAPPPARPLHTGPPTRSPLWRDASACAVWFLLVAVTAQWVAGGGVGRLVTGVPGALTELGRLTGLLASVLLLVQVAAMARIPVVEQAYGQDELTRRHRVVGFTSFWAMIAHLVLITLGYAAGTGRGIVGTGVDIVLDDPGMLLAAGGTVCLVMVVVTSIRRARRRLRYESWHLIHLYGYLGAGLALPHQLWTGQEFLANPWLTAVWWAVWALTCGAVIVFRLGLPLYRSLRHDLRVESVRRADARTTVVTVRGRDLHRMPVRAGQFLTWRFADRAVNGEGWTRGHPYSLSARPDGERLEITVVGDGDGARRVAALRPGLRVLVEGPYGRLHSGVRTRDRVLLFGCGSGIAPLKALLEDLPAAPGEIDVVHRARGVDDAVLLAEMRRLADARGARLHLVTGPRNLARESWAPIAAAHLDDATALRHLVPDVAVRDVYLCGPAPWVALAESAALAAGVPAANLHSEAFSW